MKSLDPLRTKKTFIRKKLDPEDFYKTWIKMAEQTLTLITHNPSFTQSFSLLYISSYCALQQYEVSSK